MAQYKASAIDQKMVAARILSNLKTASDYAADFSQEFQAPINGQKTSTVVVRLRPSITLADMPADRDGLLTRTGATSTSVEITLTADKYFKVAVDSLEVEAGTMESELGTAGAEAIVKAGNSDLVAALVAQGTKSEFAGAFDSDTSGEALWNQLVDEVGALRDAEYSDEFVLYTSNTAWGSLIKGIATLRTAQDPREVAATLLGVSKVRTVAMSGALAVVAHAGAAAQARVLSGIQGGREDFDDIVEGRIKLGTKVLDGAAVRVVVDAA